MSRFDYVRYDAESLNAQQAFKGDVENLERRLYDFHSALNFEDKALEASSARARASHAYGLALDALEVFYMHVGKLIKDHQIARGGDPNHQPARGQ